MASSLAFCWKNGKKIDKSVIELCKHLSEGTCGVVDDAVGLREGLLLLKLAILLF